MKMSVGCGVIEVVQGDITKQEVAAIVNAAKNSLLGGGGVDGAIHEAAGPELLAECITIGNCDTGDAVTTDGYLLPAGKVIHTVGPVWYGGNEGERYLLESCYKCSLDEAIEHRLCTIAFPAISCGVYGYPIPEAARIAILSVMDVLENNVGIDLVRFVMFDDETLIPFTEVLENL